MELKELEEFVRKASVLLAHFEDSASKITATSIKNVEHLERTIRETDEKVANILNSSALKVKDETNNAVRVALESGVLDFQTRLNGVLHGVDSHINKMTSERTAVAKQMKFFTWISIILLIIAVLSILGSIKFVLDKKNEYAQIEANYEHKKEELKQLEYSVEVKNALKKLTISSCGGEPCIKVDHDTKRWGKNGEYILAK